MFSSRRVIPPRDYKTKSDSQEIAAAVRALAETAFQHNCEIVFGGHPTISPLLLMLAREHRQARSITIYQSEYFKNHFPAATRSLIEEGFGEIRVIENDPSEPVPKANEAADPRMCPKSLAAMRKAMMRHPSLLGMVMIGGDSGLYEEFVLFRKTLPGKPIIPIGVPGGVSRELLESAEISNMKLPLREALSRSSNFLYLFSQIFRFLSTQP